MKTLLLLSGGMDSTALAYWLRPEVAVTIDYGQRPALGEIQAAATIADLLGIEHHVITADLKSLGSGDMAGSAPLEIAVQPEWWPFRNQMLVTLAGMKAVTMGLERIVIGTLKSDSFHLDGTPRFVQALNELTRLQEGEIRVEAPAIEMSAVELIRASEIPMEILAWSHSCHVADHACGTCRGCLKHFDTMSNLGLEPY